MCVSQLVIVYNSDNRYGIQQSAIYVLNCLFFEWYLRLAIVCWRMSRHGVNDDDISHIGETPVWDIWKLIFCLLLTKENRPYMIYIFYIYLYTYPPVDIKQNVERPWKATRNLVRSAFVEAETDATDLFQIFDFYPRVDSCYHLVI